MRLSFAWLACVLLPAVASAQDASAATSDASGRSDASGLSADASGLAADASGLEVVEPVAAAGPLVIHVDSELSAFGPALVRTLARRIDLEVELGAAPPGRNAAALPVGHVGILPTEEHDRSLATVTLIGAGGRIFETEVALPRERGPALRALTLAVIDLRDAELEAPPLELPEPIAPGETAPVREGRSGYVYVEPEGGLFGRRRTIEALARPTIYFRALLGYSSARQSFLIGPGVGMGLCLGDSCVVIEGDLPVLEEQRQEVNSGTLGPVVSYRAVNLALRLQLRPIRIDDVTIGVTLGLLSRVGSAWLADGTTSFVSGFGTRQSIEIAWRITGPFEWVLEGGADVAIDPARFIHGFGARPTMLEDDVTAWGLTALRVRP